MMLDKESLVRAARELPTFDYQRETPSFEVSELACFYCMLFKRGNLWKCKYLPSILKTHSPSRIKEVDLG